jgi:hypothetical protein
VASVAQPVPCPPATVFHPAVSAAAGWSACATLLNMPAHSSAASPEIFLIMFSRCGSEVLGLSADGYCRCIAACISQGHFLPDDFAGGGGHNRSAPPMGGGARAAARVL